MRLFIFIMLLSSFLFGQSKNSFLLDTKTISELDDPNNSVTAQGKDVWGYVNNQNGKEYAIMGKGADGLVIIDVTDPDNVDLVSQPFITGSNTIDIKTYSTYAYVANENSFKCTKIPRLISISYV